jgi:GNAT superfamily N-acetyltransferase
VHPGLKIRTAQASDLDGLTSLMTEAFLADPLWSWALPERGGLYAWWRFLINSALRYPCVSILGDYAAAAVWIPPGGVEITEDEEEQIEALLRRLAGVRAPDVLNVLERFDRAHPKDEPHYYLSLLGTASAHRGRGLGMGLLAQDLRRIDEVQAAAYLESSNPANDRRYAALGFRGIGTISTPDGTRTVTTMWRSPAA